MKVDEKKIEAFLAKFIEVKIKKCLDAYLFRFVENKTVHFEHKENNFDRMQRFN